MRRSEGQQDAYLGAIRTPTLVALTRERGRCYSPHIRWLETYLRDDDRDLCLILDTGGTHA
jgi:hypothetical protein